MKHCEKCGTKDNVTKHHIIPRCFGGGGGICYLCRFHHDEVEARLAKTEEQMSEGMTFPGPSMRFRLEDSEYREILRDYLNETTPIQTPRFSNVVAIPRKYRVLNNRVR